jgi:pimeloyl-ACP methyl ester carboxylesterase
MSPDDHGGGAPVSAGWSLPRGRLLRRALRTDPCLEYELYLPASGVAGAPVLVSAHGLSRVRNDHAGALVAACEQMGVTLLVPVFAGEQHADYQRLGREGRGPRADLFLHRCLREIGSQTGADTSQIYLLGHSGGAQFAHRYLMAYPHRVVRAAVVAAGWYTFPDPRLKFPYGIQSNRRLPGVVFDPEAYLKVPVTVLIGSQDTGAGALRASERVVMQQGANRLERARNWVAAMRAQAAAHGMPPRAELVELAGAGHGFTDLCQQGALVERVFHALFGMAIVGPLNLTPSVEPGQDGRRSATA